MINILLKDQFNLIDLLAIVAMVAGVQSANGLIVGIAIISWFPAEWILRQFETEPSIESYFRDFK